MARKKILLHYRSLTTYNAYLISSKSKINTTLPFSGPPSSCHKRLIKKIKLANIASSSSYPPLLSTHTYEYIDESERFISVFLSIIEVERKSRNVAARFGVYFITMVVWWYSLLAYIRVCNIYVDAITRLLGPAFLPFTDSFRSQLRHLR